MSKIFVADKLKIQGTKTLSTIALILILNLSPILGIPLATAQTVRTTVAYVSVFPTTIGIGQTLLINAWIAPLPENNTNPVDFSGVYFVLTAPDGTNTTIIPNQEPGLPPGQTESSGTVFYLYKPEMLGTWKIQFFFPGENFAPGWNYAPCTSPVTTFVVQQQPVTIGTVAPPLPTANTNWTYPIDSQNYDWGTLSGSWLQAGYNGSNCNFNPYTTAPSTAHILWTLQTTLGGIAGGDWDSFTLSGSGNGPNAVMYGKAYFSMADGIHCVNLYTGQTMWIDAGAKFTLAQLNVVTALQANTSISVEETGGPNAYLWDFNPPTWHEYDALTGALLATIPNAPYAIAAGASIGPAWDPTRGLAFIAVAVPTATTGAGGQVIPANGITANGMPSGWLICWNSSRPGITTNWANGIQWNVSLPVYASHFSVRMDGGVVLPMGPSTRMIAYSETTGQVLWDTGGPLSYNIYTSSVVGDGKAYDFTDYNMTWHAWNLNNGQVAWSSVPQQYPYGGFCSYTPAVGYGNLYVCSYDGHVYAYNDANGQTQWSFFSGNTTQTPYNVYPFYLGPLVAGGEVFAGTGEHSPTEPYWSGGRLYALNAYNGSEIWSINGWMTPVACANGYLFATNAYDGLTYCFGKGNTATTVLAPVTAIPKGTSVMIQGTVTDQSPGAKGTPAISDQDMTAWMEYLYTQQQIPGHATGVPVTLTAIDPNGNTQNIGTVTSDVAGSYAVAWTPPVPGVYTIIAAFGGSNSYFASYAETHIDVSAAPAASPSASVPPATLPPATSSPPPTVSPSVAPTPTQPASSAAPSTTLYIIVAIAVIVIVAVVAAAVVLRRRK